jgi:hypothetical protein
LATRKCGKNCTPAFTGKNDLQQNENGGDSQQAAILRRKQLSNNPSIDTAKDEEQYADGNREGEYQYEPTAMRVQARFRILNRQRDIPLAVSERRRVREVPFDSFAGGPQGQSVG